MNLTVFNLFMVCICVVVLFHILYMFFKPYKSTLKHEQVYSKVLKKYQDGKRLKVVNLYFYGLFKKVIIIDKETKIIKIYINNYFKKKFIRLW